MTMELYWTGLHMNPHVQLFEIHLNANTFVLVDLNTLTLPNEICALRKLAGLMKSFL